MAQRMIINMKTNKKGKENNRKNRREMQCMYYSRWTKTKEENSLSDKIETIRDKKHKIRRSSKDKCNTEDGRLREG